ncbi:MAG: ATP-binding cassette domain-containing protein [Chloroflexia bacterium]|nr:ATP-binding cassette domain-containing protein [Chloroflexia bacterium]
MQPALNITDLTVAYHDKPVLWDVDLEVPASTLMAIVGPNGAGKTTLIKAALGLVRPAAGQRGERDRIAEIQRRPGLAGFPAVRERTGCRSQPTGKRQCADRHRCEPGFPARGR